MRLFDCDSCGQSVHFDNRQCVRCGHRLGFVPDRLKMYALEPDQEPHWHIVSEPARSLRFCSNAALDLCNWMVDSDDPQGYCAACRHNRLVPNTGTSEGVDRWRRIGQAQRHLFYSLLRLELPHPDRNEDPQGGLVFDFLEDKINSAGFVVPAMTGHDDGLIAIRAAEADDVTREMARMSMHEPYRTLLGHFRHETGHFIWNKLVRDVNNFDGFREVFGDEREDYGAALQRHYENGVRPDWQRSFISAYASSHPWEDFAECFAHYLHIVDTLETARAFGIAVDPRGHEEMASEVDFNPYRAHDAEQLVSAWVPLSVAVNSIQRSMGQPDSYPFVLSPPVVRKLDYLLRLIRDAATGQTMQAA
ncbi:zinc-binding metallopeptidase family protein [Rhizobium tumorigenes]|uniref:zinc-binding metallopeptidase family protein n=1 Tax=Rhizobium tumorigenes TaxID=2041385 RepID=UPI00241EEA68|nr:putative zinc-binding metallopeptidase [Rhizobium tumorigenes]WFS01502.1 putative zinc-binding metallopeptidase [Rhizobium tumorigenes]